jgi:hypothetical protein
MVDGTRPPSSLLIHCDQEAGSLAHGCSVDQTIRTAPMQRLIAPTRRSAREHPRLGRKKPPAATRRTPMKSRPRIGDDVERRTRRRSGGEATKCQSSGNLHNPEVSSGQKNRAPAHRRRGSRRPSYAMASCVVAGVAMGVADDLSTRWQVVSSRG